MALRPSERDEYLVQTREDVAHIRAQIDHLVAGHADHEDRIRKIEHRIWSIPGSLLAAILTFLGFHH